MKVIVGNEKEISKLIAEEFIKVVNKKPNATLGLATGTSPLGVYAELAKANKEGRVSFKKCASFNLDEYIGLEGTHNQSYRYFMNENLFNHIDIDKNNTHVLKGVGDYVSYLNQYDDDDYVPIEEIYTVRTGNPMNTKPFPMAKEYILRIALSKYLFRYPSIEGHVVARTHFVNYLIREGFSDKKEKVTGKKENKKWIFNRCRNIRKTFKKIW